jgi:hypothetical protein
MNLELWAYKADALPLDLHLQSIFALVILEMESESDSLICRGQTVCLIPSCKGGHKNEFFNLSFYSGEHILLILSKLIRLWEKMP